MQPLFVQEKFRRLYHLSLLPALDGFQWITELVVGTRFHFDKDDDLVIQHDEIDLSPTASVVAFDDLVAFLLQVALRQSLPIPAE